MRLAILHLVLFGEVCGGGGMEILQEKRWACFVPGAKGGTGNSPQQALYRRPSVPTCKARWAGLSADLTVIPRVRKATLALASTYSLPRAVCVWHTNATQLSYGFSNVSEIVWDLLAVSQIDALRFYFNRYSFSKHIPLKRVTYLTYKWISHL